MNKKKVYIAGAISNNPDYEKDFREAEELLKDRGFVPLSPVKPLGFDYKQYIDMGLNELMHCDAICVLVSEYQSSGMMLEIKYAETAGLEIFYIKNGKIYTSSADEF